MNRMKTPTTFNFSILQVFFCRNPNPQIKGAPLCDNGSRQVGLNGVFIARNFTQLRPTHEFVQPPSKNGVRSAWHMSHYKTLQTLCPSGFGVGSHTTLGCMDMPPTPYKLPLPLTYIGTLDWEFMTWPYWCGQLRSPIGSTPVTSPPLSTHKSFKFFVQGPYLTI